MILIKSEIDCIKIINKEHSALISIVTSTLELTYGHYPIDDRPYSIYIEETDDVLRGVPHLSDNEDGLLCSGILVEGESPIPGWCWEDVRYYTDLDMYSILIIMNDDFSVEYFVPNYLNLNIDLKKALTKAATSMSSILKTDLCTFV